MTTYTIVHENRIEIDFHGVKPDANIRSKMKAVKIWWDPDTIVENNFRVLLTRARKEMILLIPRHTILDETYQYFVHMGMDEL